MKGEESPDVSKRNMERDMKFLQQITCTPKGKNIGLDDLHLLGLHRDCSPNAYGSSQDAWEIGWGDSPEPLKMEQKSKLLTTPIPCKKRLEARESPKSRCRNVRPSIRPPSKPPVDVSKYIAEVQELSKKIMSKRESEKQNSLDRKENNFSLDKSLSVDSLDLLSEDDLTNKYLIECSMSLESKPESQHDKPTNQRTENNRKSFGGTETSKQCPMVNNSVEHNNHLTSNNDSAFEKVLQSFINEEDDWLVHVVLNTESKMTPRKNSFVKTKSENELNSPDQNNKSKVPLARRSGGLTSTFRRTYSSGRVESSNCSRVNSNANETGRIMAKRTNFLSGKAQCSQRISKSYR